MDAQLALQFILKNQPLKKICNHQLALQSARVALNLKILHFNCIIHRQSQCFGAFFGCRFSVKSALLDLMRQIAVAKEDAWPKSCIDAKVLCLLHRKVIKLPFFNSYKQALQFCQEEKSKSVWKPHHHTQSLYFGSFVIREFKE